MAKRAFGLASTRATALCAGTMLLLSALPCRCQTEKESPSASTGTQQSTDVSKSSEASAKDQIPDALKDLVPKDAQTSLSFPATNSKPVVPSQSTPAVNVPAANPSASQAAASAPPPSAKLPAASAPSAGGGHITLRGRLEELGGRGASLPAGVVLNLKTRSAKLDQSFEHKLQGRVASFPVDWRGSWSGSLKVWTNQFDPVAFDFDPEETQEVQRVMAPGQAASVTFTFFQQNNQIALQPAQMVFPPRKDTPMARQMQQQIQNSPLAQMLGSQGGQLLAEMSAGTPVFVLGDLAGVGVTGNALNNQLVKNDIRQLKPGVLEQNLVVEQHEKHRKTGEQENSIAETVLRFTKISATQLYVQAASIDYRWDGHFKSKVIFYGTVTRGAASSPLPTGFPTGFPMPGITPGGGGNLNDLNNLLKQMQGM